MSLLAGNLVMYYSRVVYVLIFLYLPFFLYKTLKAKRSSLPINWPVLGMLPGLLLNCNRTHDFLTDILEEAGGTFLIKGPWLSNMDMMVTADPANVHYVLSKNFQNFPKGPQFKKIFDILGDGMVNADDERWKSIKEIAMPILKPLSFQTFSATVTWEKLEKGLIPILDLASETGTYVDIQDLFKRFTFDCSCTLALSHDPGSLRPDLPYLPHEKAFAEVEEAILLRHVFPETLWKLQEWLRIGKEHKLANARKSIHQFLANAISLRNSSWEKAQGKNDSDVFAGLMRTSQGLTDIIHDSLEYFILDFILAGKDTISAGLTWFFYLIARHPEEQEKIRQEIVTHLSMGEGRKWSFTSIDELKTLHLLHGALCETLRLFPPIPFQHKAVAETDTLPSGHKITTNTKALLSFYTMGRTEAIWGRDCLEFKPERWITETGSIRSVPSFKFTAFNSGPRSCLGKEISFIQMKIVAAAIIGHFHIQVMEDHPVKPSISIMLTKQTVIPIETASSILLS